MKTKGGIFTMSIVPEMKAKDGSSMGSTMTSARWMGTKTLPGKAERCQWGERAHRVAKMAIDIDRCSMQLRM